MKKLIASGESETVGETVGENDKTPKETPKEKIKLTNLEANIIGLIREDKFTTALKISQKLNISVYTVREYIKKIEKEK
ncbi:MAG: helix-turn-helix transcriptional regulator [bacterium]